MGVSTTLRSGTAGVPAPAAVLELLKPVTWFPPMWAFGCGVVSSGVAPGARPVAIGLGLLLVGPLVCASSQAVNDWFDRHVDAINEPLRPIPSGRIPGRWGLWLALFWSGMSLGVGALLGVWGFVATVLALVLAWAYSAPPVRLKRNGWYGNAAVGFTYEGLAWVTGAAVMLGGVAPPREVLVLAVLYSLGAHGIMTLNDFKAIEGDRRTGIGSLPARLGPERAAWTACVVMLVPQVMVIAHLVLQGAPAHAGAVGVLLALQILLMRRFLAAPVANALFYSAVGVPVYVLGMMVSAFAIRGGIPT
jgi:chlorophyll/bacteriochlorophyll a synthase